MSDSGFQKSIGSSSLGLTFIRPMPTGETAPGQSEKEGSSVREQVFQIADRLFPPRALEESGAAPPVAGVELGHFIIEERIGRGGMGAVFRALDRRLGRVVAIKVLNVEHSSDPEAVLRFQNEARAAARLDHENIARVYFIGEEHGLHFIAFEFVMGANVRNLIQQHGVIPPADAVNYTLQIAEALRHTNEANVVHRDIKPSNIIITPTGRAKLVDLGLARHSNPDLSRDLTTVGTALGTFDYIAPEQALDARNVDVRSDIYSLGCTLYHMLTGSPPYPTGTMFEKVMNHHRPVPPNPAEKNRKVSPHLARIVQKMMAANPDDRYATPDALIEDLTQVAYSLGLQPTVNEARIWQSPSYGRDPTRWNGIRTWGTVALILVIVVLADRLRSVPITPPPSPPSISAPSSLTLNHPASEAPGIDLGIPEIQLGEKTELPSPLSPDPATLANRLPPAYPTNFPTSPEQLFDQEDSVLPPLGQGMPSSSPTIGGTLLPEVNSNTTTDTNTTPSEPAPSLNRPAEEMAGANPSESSPSFSQFPALPMEAGPSSPASSPPAVSLGPTLLSELASQMLDSASRIPESIPVIPAAPPTTFVAVRPATDDQPEERISAPTLAAACSLAKDGWSVELPVGEGVIPVKDTIHISNKKIRLIPARDSSKRSAERPLVRVDLSEVLSMGPFVRAASMFQVERGGIELVDLDIELLVTSTSNVDWSVASLVNGSRLTANGVTITIINPGNSRAALVDVPSHDGSDDMELMPDRTTSSQQNSVEVTNSLCRGQFDFAVLLDSPLSIRIVNSAIALSGCLLRIDGSEAGISTPDVDSERQTSLSLDQATLVTGRGLLNANSGDHGSLPEIQLSMSGSICTVNSDDQIHQPLLEISGHENFEMLLDLLEIRTQRETTFLQLAGPFILIDFTRAQLPGSGRELTPEQVSARNLQVVQENLLQITTGLKLADWHRITRTDLQLSTSDLNPALSQESTHHHAGVNWSLPGTPDEFPEAAVQ